MTERLKGRAMVAYSFKPQFVEPILAGSKGGTIRSVRRGSGDAVRAGRGPGGSVIFAPRPGGHAFPGEELQLYTGMRTKHCQLIARTRCSDTQPITLDFRLNRISLGYFPPIILRGANLDRFAEFDGFSNWAEMQKFWSGTSFFGWHIRWLPLPQMGVGP